MQNLITNYFDLLPSEIQCEIYHHAHTLLLRDVHQEMESIQEKMEDLIYGPNGCFKIHANPDYHHVAFKDRACSYYMSFDYNNLSDQCDESLECISKMFDKKAECTRRIENRYERTLDHGDVRVFAREDCQDLLTRNFVELSEQEASKKLKRVRKISIPRKCYDDEVRYFIKPNSLYDMKH